MPAAFGLGVVLWLAAGFSENRADTDTWIYLNFGREFFRGAGFLHRDVFAYVPTVRHWVFHEWLAGVLFYPVYAALGAAGLTLWKYLIGFSTAAAAYGASLRRGTPPRAAAAALPCGLSFVFSAFAPLRAQVFTFLFLALTILVLEDARGRERPGRAFVLVPIFALWANLHGGFLAGLGVTAIYAAARAIERRPLSPFLLLLLSSTAATLVNPYGFRLWTSVITHAAAPEARVTEWDSVLRALSLGENLWTVFAFFTAGAAAALLFARRLKSDLPAALTLAALFILGLSHIRHVALFGLALSIYGGRAAVDLWRARGVRRKAVFAALMAAFSPFAVVVLLQNVGPLVRPDLAGSPLALECPSCPRGEGGDPCYPVGAVRYIREHGMKGKIAANYAWGAFLSFFLNPGCLGAVDARCETVFPEDVRKAYFEFLTGGPRWRDFLAAYPPDMILLRNGTVAAHLLSRDPAWKKTYEDEGSVLFTPRTPQPLSKR